MLQRDARVGMKVIFGRSGANAEKSLGQIEKINPKSAKVRLLEERGTYKSFPVGSMFGVPYSMMEPEGVVDTPVEQPDQSDKYSDNVWTPKGVDTLVEQPEKIIPGITTFHYHHADSNPLWLVKSKYGANVWLCEITKGEWKGHQRTFMTREILAVFKFDKLLDRSGEANERYYANLKPGQIVYRGNGNDQFTRCRVVEEKGKNVLLPIALVGNWREFELPSRNKNGKVYLPPAADDVINKKTMRVHFSQMHVPGSSGIDPSSLPVVSLEVPDMTPQERANAALWVKVEKIHDLSREWNGDPAEVLAKVRKVLGD